MKKISIIVPIYNIEKYLPRCLDSILAQTYKNLEVILVDDGSIDNSGVIADKYARKDQRIKVIHQVNQGVSVARNTGIDLATGDYIGFVDGDDYIEPDMYEILMRIIDEQQVDIAHCGYQMVYPSKTEYYYNTKEKIKMNREEGVLELLKGRKVEPGLWNKLYNAKLFEQVRLPAGIAETEDLLCNFELFSFAKNSYFYDIAKYHYMLRSGSATNEVLSEKKRRDRYYVVSSIMHRVSHDDIYYAIAYERYLRILIENSMQKDYSDLQNESLIKLRQEIKNVIFCKGLGLKIKGIAIATSYFQVLYRMVRFFYNRITRIDNRYEIK